MERASPTDDNRKTFFRTPLQQQTEPPTTFSCCQQQAEGLVEVMQILSRNYDDYEAD